MAKQQQNNNGFELPSIALAKTDESSVGSRQWLKSMTREHGDTDPLKLEKRRARLSALVSLVDDGFTRTQLEKKTVLARHDKKIKELIDESVRVVTDPSKQQELKGAIQHLKNSRETSESQYSLILNQQVVNLSMLEALCLVVDSVTVRESLTNPASGKKGTGRISAGLCMDEAADATLRLYRRMRKLYELMAHVHAANPTIDALLQKHKEDEDDSADDEIGVINDDDILTAEESEEIKKGVTA